MNKGIELLLTSFKNQILVIFCIWLDEEDIHVSLPTGLLGGVRPLQPVMQPVGTEFLFLSTLGGAIKPRIR